MLSMVLRIDLIEIRGGVGFEEIGYAGRCF
jgi:hypothetical protein